MDDLVINKICQYISLEGRAIYMVTANHPGGGEIINYFSTYEKARNYSIETYKSWKISTNWSNVENDIWFYSPNGWKIVFRDIFTKSKIIFYVDKIKIIE